MVDLAPQFETKDSSGTTSQFVGSVGTAVISVPVVSGGEISECLVRCGADNTPMTKRLLYSFDGGATFMKLSPGEYVGWSLKGGITQIQIKGSVAGVDYEVILNRENPA